MFAEPQASLREARMLAVLTRERKRVEQVGATVEQRAFDVAETTAVWRNAL